MKLEIHKVGEELVITLPGELRSQLQWQSGDLLEGDVVDAGLRIVRTATKHERAMKVMDEVIEEYSGTLQALARS